MKDPLYLLQGQVVIMVTVRHPTVVYHHQKQLAKMLRKKKPGSQTWTSQFMCLYDKITDKIPNSTQKQALHKAGLGLKKTVFDLEDTEEEVYAKLTSSELDEDQNTIGFPQLRNCGGFKLLWCVPSYRELETIECVMAVKTLKTSVGQGIIVSMCGSSHSEVF